MKKSPATLLIISAFAYSPAWAQAVIRQENIDVRNTEINNEYPVARAYAPNVRTNSGCALPNGGGVQLDEIGISWGGTRQDIPCDDRANASAAAGLGLLDMAQRMTIITTCLDPRYKALQECVALAVAEPEQEKDACEYPTPDCKRSQKNDRKVN